MYLNATRLAIKNGEHTWGRGKHGFIRVITRYDLCIHSHVHVLLQMSKSTYSTIVIGRMHTLRKHVLLGHIEHSTRYWSSPGVCACMYACTSVRLLHCMIVSFNSYCDIHVRVCMSTGGSSVSGALTFP